MKISVEKKHEKRIEAVVEGMDSSFANVIRRYTISHVPVLAINTVSFYNNSSSLWDEYISHRLGLLPIVTPANLPENVEIMFSLNEEGPKVIKSGDLKSNDSEIKVAKDNITIVTLGPGQPIKLEGKAVLGTGLTHAKFQSGLASFGVDGSQVRFKFECFFNMSPSELVIRACDILESDIEDLLAQLTGKERIKKAVEKKEKVVKAKKATKKKAKAEKSEEKE